MMYKIVAGSVPLLTIVCLSSVTSGLRAQPPAAPIKIREGTALAKLVEEAKSHVAFASASVPTVGARVEIPTWLRAHYRRNHAEMRKVVSHPDPTGGYPLALENLHAWMLLHQDLQPSPSPPSKAAAAVTAGQNLRISGKQDSPRSESDIRINFTNPAQIIAGSNDIGNGRQAQFFSSDGGVSWGQTTLPLLAGDSLHSDPTVDWTSDGTAWATTIGIDATSTVLQMRAYKSTDGGNTWSFDSTFSGDQTSADKQMVWVDRSPTSPFRDNIYAIWHNNQPAFVNHRDSSGWQSPIQVSGAETTATAIGGDIKTNSVGTVFAVWPDTGSHNLFFVKSTDGAATFSSPLPIGKTIATFQINVPAFAERAALVGVSIAAFKNDSRDDVYVSFLDLSGDSGCNTAGSEPGDDVNSDCKSRVWFTRSTDGGKTWSEAAKKINDDGGRTDQFNHKLAVDPDDGTLGIVYYGTGTGADRKKTNLMFQLSTDNGKTWSSPIQVTTKTTDETTVSADNGNQYGDYNGLSVLKGVFFPSWTDRRDNESEEIYTAKVTVQKDAAGVARPVLVQVNQSGQSPVLVGHSR
jgi:hypothetical protein